MNSFIYIFMAINSLPLFLIFPQEQNLKKLNFISTWVPQPQFIIYCITKKGIYKEYGFDVNINSYKKDLGLWRNMFNENTIGFLKKQNIETEIFRINEGINLFLKSAVNICAVMNYNEYSSLINYYENPNELSVFYINSYDLNFQKDEVYRMEDTHNKILELCKNFVKASTKRWECAFANTEETLIIMKKFQKLANTLINNMRSELKLKYMKDMIYPTDKNMKTENLLGADFNRNVEPLIENEIIFVKPCFSNFHGGSK